MKTILTLCAGLLLMSASTASAQSCCNTPQAGQISVSATGQSYRVPDTATVSAGVVTQAATAGEAMAANSRQMNATFNALLQAGVAQRNIQTSQLSLQPRYDYTDRQAPKITGYEARNTVTAKSENLESVGAMLDALVRAGANNINGVTFSIKNPEAAKSEARAMAIQNARRQAEEMAGAAGIRLGRIVSLTESGGYNQPRPMMMSARADSMESTPVAAGEQALSVTVNITYEIVQ
ncbi:MAG: SIMPL domain-containing protein [Alphaproteobacteria bacterium]